ncbi:unnamed protein product [Paramecium sonneborni]|uniref:C2H2-type domain-containing protein n=1 Tax=Paramecium sonneborni TaxID=65129 RepID=A0A8S1N3N8_9CILI|nr:unnamed protein product [Paramecium sonneborni]
MKFIPLTQHFETVAMLYEKCAAISEQLEMFQKQSTLQISNGQIESDDTQQLQKNSLKKVKKSKIKQKKQNKQAILIEENNDRITMDKKKPKKSPKIIEKKVPKQKVQFTCNHCNKIFESSKVYNKHRYQLKYRQNQLKKKQQKLNKNDSNQIEQPQNKRKRLNNKKNGVL